MILRLAARGDGVDEAGNFHGGAVPGDAIAADGSIIAGPYRQEPACRHFGTCGGCQLQHVADGMYAQFLMDRIATALAAHGLEAVLRPPHLSPAGSRRRASLRALRKGKQVQLGYAEGGSHKLVDLSECSVLHPQLFALITPLRRLLQKILPERKTAKISMTIADQGIDLSLSGVEVEGLDATQALSDFAASHELARLSIDEGFGMQSRWEPDPVTITLGQVAVPFPEGAFLQATVDAEAMLLEAVLEAVGQPERPVDLFAGLGTFTFSLPGKVHAAEGARDAVLALQQAVNRLQRPVTTEHRDLFRRPLLATELGEFDAAVLDPPRAGAKEQATELAGSNVPVIVYVSCNPSTFARDARTLVDGGYRLEWIQPVGQFRWSTHVELAARFVR